MFFACVETPHSNNALDCVSGTTVGNSGHADLFSWQVSVRLSCSSVTAVRSLQDASCRHDSSRSFALLVHCVRPGGRRGSQQHQLFCTSKLFPLGALGGPRPLCGTPRSTYGSTHEFSCAMSLCTLDKRLNRQHVCSTPFCAAKARSANLLWHSLH